ncbi:MAG: TRAP transporter TatT component family protein [Spirochaetes bacterium]|jgi:hypothetical protein|nr:TRAP transporter TatT component family protein [Spirochaetota bacterium]
MSGIHFGKTRKLKILVVIVVFCFAGCLTLTRAGLNNADPVFDELVKSMMDLPSAQVAIDGMPGTALMISALVSLSPDNPKLNGMAAMVYGSWGMLIEEDKKDYAMELYGIGESYGLQGIKCLDEDIKNGMEKDGKGITDFLNKMSKDNMDIVFWYVLNKALRMFGDMENPYILAEAGDVLSVIQRIGEIDPSYFYYCPALFNAAFHAFGGPMMGITHEKANEEFKAALAKTNNKMLLGYWLYARFYCITLMDEKLFDETCQYVMDTPSSDLKGGRLINEIAKLKVKKLMADKSKYF